MIFGGLQLFFLLIVVLWVYLISAEYDIKLVKIGLYYNINFNKGKAVTIWPYEIDNAAEIVKNPRFVYNQTVLYVPGYDDHASVTQNVISKAFLKRRTRNYMQVIWSANGMPETNDIKTLASQLANQILQMFNAGLERESFHLLAYSDGHELAGLTATEIIQQSNGNIKLHRITSLDQPVNQDASVVLQRITKRHADFVDAIHTDKDGYGLNFDLAHADFWPNGGNAPQPGCSIAAAKKGHSRCSHQRAYRYFAESFANIGGPEFIAYPAANYKEFHDKGPSGFPVPMGINCPMSARGNYFLDTNTEPPYAKGAI